MLKRIPEEQQARLIAEAGRSPLSDEAVAYPHWYLHRWHFLPEGYLSRRGVSLYELGIVPLYYEGQERRIVARVADALEAAQPGRVIEVACGPGRAVAEYRRRLPGTHFTGIDLSPYMLERARTRLPAGVDLVHGDSRALPWEDGQFDAVVSTHHAGHVPRREAVQVLREALRVLRPGGTFVLVEHRWHRLPPLGLDGYREELLAAGLIRVITGRKRARRANAHG